METSWSLHVGDVQVRELNRLQCFPLKRKETPVAGGGRISRLGALQPSDPSR